MHGVALAILIYLGVSGLWDILDPDAVTVKFGSIFRGLATVAAQTAIIVLCLLVLGAAGTTFLLVFAGLFCIACLGAAVNS